MKRRITAPEPSKLYMAPSVTVPDDVIERCNAIDEGAVLVYPDCTMEACYVPLAAETVSNRYGVRGIFHLSAEMHFPAQRIPVRVYAHESLWRETP